MCDYVLKEQANELLKEKVENFINKVENFRKEQEYMPLNEFIWKLYLDTGYYSYVGLMPNGVLRVSNLKMLFERAKQYEKTSFKGLYNFISFIDKLKLSSSDMSGAKLIGENENIIRIMSIHKSKGLEFPVVFLCGTSKHFNMQDINKNPILLHQDLGLGPKYINYEEGETYTTLARETIKLKTRLELISEEMRVLYVALTRAKEKLIITGLEKDYRKSIEKKEVLLNSYEEIEDNGRINKNITKKYISYLDWIELVCLKRESEFSKIAKVYTYNEKELIKGLVVSEEKSENDLNEQLKNVSTEDIEKLKNVLDWKYKYKIANNILTKSSVTKIKSMKIDLEESIESEYNEPEFLKEKRGLTNAEKGTLMHLLFQRLDVNVDYDEGKILEFIDMLERKGIINKIQRDSVDIKKLYNFTKTDIWRELKSAKEIQREKPFYINIPANEVYDEDIDDNILVQGIIDLYYITDDDRLVLIDYKTDRVRFESELVDKYSKQLMLYKKALECSLGKVVDRVCIYSVYLDNVIIV